MKHKYISTPGAPSAIGPYSQAVSAGGFLFCSGQIPLDPVSGEIVPGIKEGTARVLKNLQALLSAEGLDLSHVVKTTVYLTDMKSFSEMNEVYGEFFGEFRPARACVEVSALPKGVSVEIEAVAYKKEI